MTFHPRRWLAIPILLLLLLLLGNNWLTPGPARAETRLYIAENLKVIPVRAGKGMEFK
ncbi:MAG: hypothetical protein JRJ56_03580, partial [Deltaproteobacteria bacterium]|nr:hypothetical protein [Deltaproteobacteria bacterium]